MSHVELVMMMSPSLWRLSGSSIIPTELYLEENKICNEHSVIQPLKSGITNSLFPLSSFQYFFCFLSWRKARKGRKHLYFSVPLSPSRKHYIQDLLVIFEIPVFFIIAHVITQLLVDDYYNWGYWIPIEYQLRIINKPNN